MSNPVRTTIVVVFVSAVLACGPRPQNTDTGRGDCTTLVRSTEELAGPPDLPDGSPRPICAGSKEAQANSVSLPSIGACACDSYQDVEGELLDPARQRQALDARAEAMLGCKGVDGPSFVLTDGIGCYQLGYVNGFITSDIKGVGGNQHDGDNNPGLCPFDQGVHNGLLPVEQLELRDHHSFRTTSPSDYSFLHSEFQWCRWFGGPITIAADQSHIPPLQAIAYPEFRPQAGERISMVGDWILDGARDNPTSAHAELHEVRFGATIRKDVVPPAGGGSPEDVWYILASGFFARSTAQQDLLSMSVPIPKSANPLNTNFKCGLVESDVGCSLNEPANAARIDIAASTDARGDGVCTIKLERGGEPELLSEPYCGEPATATGPKMQCPCFGELLPDGTDPIPDRAEDANMLCSVFGYTSYASMQAVRPGRCVFDGLRKDPFYPDVPVVVTRPSRIAFAGAVRAEWEDPIDLWNCVCACDDPSTPGASILARVQGCAEPGLENDRPGDLEKACGQACGGQFCGGDPSCRIGTCRPAGARAAGVTVARQACVPPAPANRVAKHGDFEVTVSPDTSLLEIGRLVDGVFVLDATARVGGKLFVSDNPIQAERMLEFSNFDLVAENFSLIVDVPPPLLVTVTGPFSFTQRRVLADLGPKAFADGSALLANHWSVPAGAMIIGVRARVLGKSGGAEFVNDGPISGTFDRSNLTLMASGHTEDGRAMRLHVVGAVTNRPPVPEAGRNGPVECDRTGAAAIRLDGTASTDPDGDVVAHYQWFEGDVGLGNQPIRDIVATLGPHDFTLHVYDPQLASEKAQRLVSVVDTTPPTLTVSTAIQCLWPPNHAFAKIVLGREIRATTSDVCSSAISLKIKTVTSDEVVDGTGDGHTSPDVAFGDTTACLRSERAGTGVDRHYSIVVEASDQSNNKSEATIRITVPHDRRDTSGCTRAEGVESLDASCRL